MTTQTHHLYTGEDKNKPTTTNKKAEQHQQLELTTRKNIGKKGTAKNRKKKEITVLRFTVSTPCSSPNLPYKKKKLEIAIKIARHKKLHQRTLFEIGFNFLR
ncbi:hypothetical protein CEXT_75741 [Caerostris extrusa]|uniref:Uncharacterized protein n=1 Tax=Caerostris extrusa TaxID=172846 RepID=A0AAV4NM63_CAEEX|nr:hypothetical protein CEXT_75741 [Caerostris extrusa]